MTLAQAIIKIAETLGHVTIAEGIETAAQVEHLRELGCRFGQGYHLGVPLDARETEEMLRERKDTRHASSQGERPSLKDPSDAFPAV